MLLCECVVDWVVWILRCGEPEGLDVGIGLGGFDQTIHIIYGILMPVVHQVSDGRWIYFICYGVSIENFLCELLFWVYNSDLEMLIWTM